MKPTIYAVCIIAVVLALMWMEAARRNSRPQSSPRVIVTQERYEAIQPGMTLQEVIDIAGEPSHSISDKTPTTEYEILYWQGNEAMMNCTMVEGKVTVKDGSF